MDHSQFVYTLNKEDFAITGHWTKSGFLLSGISRVQKHISTLSGIQISMDLHLHLLKASILNRVPLTAVQLYRYFNVQGQYLNRHKSHIFTSHLNTNHVYIVKTFLGICLLLTDTSIHGEKTRIGNFGIDHYQLSGTWKHFKKSQKGIKSLRFIISLW